MLNDKPYEWSLDNPEAVEHVLKGYPEGSKCLKLSPFGYEVAEPGGIICAVSGSLHPPGWVPSPNYYVLRTPGEEDDLYEFISKERYEQIHRQIGDCEDILMTVLARNYDPKSAEASWRNQDAEDWWYSTN